MSDREKIAQLVHFANAQTLRWHLVYHAEGVKKNLGAPVYEECHRGACGDLKQLLREIEAEPANEVNNDVPL